ncbi:hypothetical protein [Spirulina sp. 06S082]|nr:hypothetical protein [Spirulina sp. 06S082]MEA5471017.1 hypothetical protein [Spirulina sp. 06S082]
MIHLLFNQLDLLGGLFIVPQSLVCYSQPDICDRTCSLGQH